MGLPSELISQFVKATRDDKKTRAETTVYGTTVEENGTMYVRLDGSDLLTPVETTAQTKAGERVLVLIKNHTATITGNITTPSAQSTVVVTNTKDIENLKEEVNAIDADTVVSSGINGIWNYEKRKSGKTECWGRYTATGVNAAANNLDGLYYSAAISITFPVTFKEKPVVIVNGGDISYMHYIREFGSTTEKAVFVVVCNDSTQTSVNIDVPIYVIGNT